MHSEMKFFAAVTSLSFLSILASGYAVTLDGVASSNVGQSSEGAPIAYTNPHFSSLFTTFCDESFTPKGRSELARTPGVTLLDFEEGGGFGVAGQSLSETNGMFFLATDTVAPYSLPEAVSRISTKEGRSLAVEWRTFDNKANTLSPANEENGVFLVRDRISHKTVTSGSQGLIAGAIHGGAPGGAYFTFDQNLSDFGVALNCGSGNEVIDVIALFDADERLIAKYRLGIAARSPLYFGVNSPKGLIRSVWIGQETVANGLVIDDVAFKPVSASMGRQ
jgi:hypothetical protein